MGARYVVAAFVALSGCSFDIAEEPVSDVEVTWQITMAGVDTACRDVDASLVRVTFDAPAGHRFADWFPCDDLYGVSRYLPVDDYTVTATAIDPGGRELRHAPAVAVEASMQEPSMTLPEFQFQFDIDLPRELALQ